MDTSAVGHANLLTGFPEVNLTTLSCSSVFGLLNLISYQALSPAILPIVVDSYSEGLGPIPVESISVLFLPKTVATFANKDVVPRYQLTFFIRVRMARDSIKVHR